MSSESLSDLLRRRTWAGWIDVLMLAMVYVIISAATGNAHIGTWTTYGRLSGPVVHHGFFFGLPTGPLLIWIVCGLLYYSVDEVMTGQTVGKRALGLQVVRVDGRPLDGRAVALRTLGRFLDVLPFFYLLGWIALRVPHRSPQRLGDRIAGTAVLALPRR